jgi:universal stress protein E
MKQINNILVAGDSLDGMEAAMAKAAKIEHYTGANVWVAVVIYDAIAEEDPDRLPPEQQSQLVEALKAAERNGLRQLTDPYRSRIATLDDRVVWNKNSAEGLLHVQTEVHADLIIKPISKHGFITDHLHTPLDWALMRGAQGAVLISKKSDWAKPQRVLAAIDVADTRHADLSREILLTAATMARTLDVELHVVTAFPSLGQTVNDLQVAMDYEGIKRDMRENRTAAIARWIEELDIGITDSHVLEGKPELVIPQLASDLAASLTVLGTAARQGIRKLLIGNTAEDIIARLDCDILTVREP